MAVYKRGGVYWFEFVFNGERVQRSTKQSNQRVAGQIESAYKTKLAKGEVGLDEVKPVPSFKEFSTKFIATIETRSAGKPNTIKFYKDRVKRLLEYGPFVTIKLNRIDEEFIEKYVLHRRKKVSVVSVNRELATLRRMLRLAHEWKIIRGVPRIRLLAGETNREFVLSAEDEKKYLLACPQPLQDIATLILDTGLRPGEAVVLQKADIHLEPVGKAKFGYIKIRDGKTKNAKRTVSLTPRVKEMLATRMKKFDRRLFPGERENEEFFLVTSLDHQHIKVRVNLEMPSTFVVHSLRHTMLTRLGEAGVDAFTIMKIAGHSSITTSQKYVHPSSEALELAFEKLMNWKSDLPAKVPTVPSEGGIEDKINSAK